MRLCPAGMSFSPDGTFSGTPVRRGTQRFNVTATNIVGTTVILATFAVASPPEWVDWFAPSTVSLSHWYCGTIMIHCVHAQAIRR